MRIKEQQTVDMQCFSLMVHDLRRAFASRFAMLGVDMATLMNLLGHKTISMTLRYAHFSDKHRQEAVELLINY